MIFKIVVLGTGGTIAGLRNPPSSSQNQSYTAAQMKVQSLLDQLPHLQHWAHESQMGIEAEQVAQLDSKDMDFATQLLLARRCAQYLAQPEVCGLVITHGTDTLEETAFFLHAVIPVGLQAKPIVLTCAMRPADSPEADGPVNLLDALRVCADPLSNGVLVVCAGQVHAAEFVQKIHSHALAAFSSGDEALGEIGPVGFVLGGNTPPAVKQVLWSRSGEHFLKEKAAKTTEEYAQEAINLIATRNIESIVWPRVEIVLNHTSADGTIVHALLAYSEKKQALCGIVVAGTGNGTLSEGLHQALKTAQSQGIKILRASRCAWGGVSVQQGDEFEATHLPPSKARVKLTLDLLSIV